MKTQQSKVKREIISWLKVIAFGLVLALLINKFLIVNTVVASGSMETTIMTHDRVMGSRLSYLFKGPQRLDIVAFYMQEEPDAKEVIYVKRVIGLPGDTVEIVDGKVYVNNSDVPMVDWFVNGTPRGDYGPFTVPENHYFMLGDNRNSSYDSKDWPDPYVSGKKIIGKLKFRYYPGIDWLEDVSE